MAFWASNKHSVSHAGWGRTTLAGIVSLIYFFPVLWIILTAFKTHNDALAVPPKWFFTPTLENFIGVFSRTYSKGQEAVDTGFDLFFFNSIFIAGISVLLAIIIGTLAAYAFSRYPLRGNDTYLFVILTTRMLPPIVVIIPIFLMFRNLGLSDTHTGMILLYTAVNLSLSVWLLKGFIDEIPREYEEAALIDGYTRFQAFTKVVLPQAATGIAATAIFCLIFAWNEYAFAVLLTSGTAQTAPPFIPTIIGNGGQDWPAVAAGATLFLLPVMVFTILLRKHLLRGITFGAVRK